MNKPQNCGTSHCSCIECVMKDEDDVCSWCNGCGEGDYDGAACRKCHGTGVEPVEQETDDCYDID